MEIHNYQAGTGIYVGSDLADESPLQPGVWLVPANATDIPPPPPEAGFYRVFNGSSWGYQDMRALDAGEEPPVTEEPEASLLPLRKLNFWLAAAEVGVTIETVRAQVAAIPDPIERARASAFVEFAEVYRREDPLLIAMAEAQGITSSQLDALWAWAQA